MISWLLSNRNFKVIPAFFAGMISYFSSAQNLISNPGFEDTISCPYSNGQSCPNTNMGSFDAILFWTNPICTSPDLYNSCTTSWIISTPNNIVGYQIPHSGSAYAGVCSNLTFVSKPNNEYVLSPLSQSLLTGEKYIVSFWVSFTRDKFTPTLWNGTNAIGAFLSIGWPDTTGSKQNEKINAVAQVNNPYNNILSDTLNWVLISDTITAVGGEDHITIGNFTPDSLEQGDGAYFFIDDVSVYWYNGIEEHQNNQFTIFPNPASENVTIRFKKTFSGNISIYDTQGRILKTNAVKNQTSIVLGINDLPQGYYLLKAENNQAVFVSRITVAR